MIATDVSDADGCRLLDVSDPAGWHALAGALLGIQALAPLVGPGASIVNVGSPPR